MYSHPQQGVTQSDVLKLRQEAGRWLRSLREAAGLSQRELASRVGIDYYTFISQIESGRGRVPPAQTKLWADALRISKRQLAMELLRFYDPLTYDLIFSTEAPNGPDLEARVAKLERTLKGS